MEFYVMFMSYVFLHSNLHSCGFVIAWKKRKLWSFLTSSYEIHDDKDYSFFFRDFDANLYLCEEAFGLLPLNTFSRLSDTLLFYIYVFVLFLMAVAAVIVAFRNLR